MSDRTFVDTNVIVYLFDDSEPEKQATAEEALRREYDGGAPVVSTSILGEMYVALSRLRGSKAKPLPPLLTAEEADAAVRAMSRFRVVEVTQSIVLAAMARARSEQMQFWDALHVSTALEHGCTTFLTEDLQDGRRFDHLTIHNPFASEKSPPSPKRHK